MNEQTQKLIEQLAQKLGTTAEHLWGVLVKQAPISATFNSIGIALAGAVVLILIYYCRRSIKKYHQHGLSYEQKETQNCISWYCALTALAVGGIALISACAAGDMIAAGFMNPEYWALKQLIK